jgi:hypothetical protein
VPLHKLTHTESRNFFGKPAEISKGFLTDGEYDFPVDYVVIVDDDVSEAKRFKLLCEDHLIHALRLSVRILCCNGTKSAVLIRCFVNSLA